MKDPETLSAVAIQAKSAATLRARLEADASDWIQAQMQQHEAALDEAVMGALSDGHSVTDVARAYTISGKTPNRNRIYEIKARNNNNVSAWSGKYPFRWVELIVETATGERTVYDVVATADNFGPEKVNGIFRWRYDSGALEPVLDADPNVEPFPVSTFYAQLLDRWLKMNPYPGGAE